METTASKSLPDKDPHKHPIENNIHAKERIKMLLAIKHLNSCSKSPQRKKSKVLQIEPCKAFKKLDSLAIKDIVITTKKETPSDIHTTTPKCLRNIRKNSIVIQEKIKHEDEINDNKKALDYIFGEEIGKGGYANVRLAIHKPSLTRLAMKMYDKLNLNSAQRQSNVAREIQNLSKLSHPNIVKLTDVLDTQEYVILALEYIEGLSLNSYIRRRTNRMLPESEASLLFRQIVSGIAYCHEHLIVHRDIKLDNILVTDKKLIKIIDFGFSTDVIGHKKLKLYCGTPSFMAPEIVKREEFDGEPADIWALGVVLYTLLCGYFPFRGNTREELFSSIVSGIFIIPPHVSGNACDLLRKMLCINPKDRLTASGILNCPWLCE
jgi:MAP/microtubule affinity-regulating kinase